MSKHEHVMRAAPFNEKPVASASWLPPDVAAQKYPYKSGSFWLGRNPVDDTEALGVHDDRHVLLVAAPRSGKGRSLIVNNLIVWPGSIISIDPKGENATLTARARAQGSEYCEGMGQDVYVLDPFNTTSPEHIDHGLRAFYNPLNDIDADDPELHRFASRIAESMIIAANKNNPQWDIKGGEMIAALIMHVKTSRDFTDEQRNLVTVRDLLQRGDWQAEQAMANIMAKKNITQFPNKPSAHELLWKRVSKNTACEGILSGYGHSFLQSWQHQRQYYNSVRTSAEDNTKWLDSPGMRAVVRGNDKIPRTFKADELKSHPKGISVYLCLPQADMATYARWQRMMVDLMLAAMQKSQTKPACGHRVLFSLDEFAGLGKMERIRTAAAEVAGAGVKLFLAVQGLNQLKEIYEDGWEIFVGSAGVQIYFGIGDNFTREYLQTALGKTEIVRTTYNASHSISAQQTHGTSEGYSTSAGYTETEGESSGWSVGRSGGKNKNWSKSGGRNSGQGYGPHVFFEGLEKTTNYGKNRGWTKGKGTHSGWQEGTTGGTNASRAYSASEQQQYSTQQSETSGRTEGWGSNQTIHTKPLLTMDEANKLFARIDDPNHPAFPGLALVRIAGEDPALVRLAHYDRDPQFIRKFDPHPDHEYIPYKTKEIQSSAPKEPRKIRTVSQYPCAQELSRVRAFDDYLYSHERSRDHAGNMTIAAEKVMPFDLDTVWDVITQSKYWFAWLPDTNGFRSEVVYLTDLPDKFLKGDVVRFKDANKKPRLTDETYKTSNAAIITKAVNKQVLGIRHLGGGGEGQGGGYYDFSSRFCYEINLSSAGRDRTRVKIHQIWMTGSPINYDDNKLSFIDSVQRLFGYKYVKNGVVQGGAKHVLWALFIHIILSPLFYAFVAGYALTKKKSPDALFRENFEDNYKTAKEQFEPEVKKMLSSLDDVCHDLERYQCVIYWDNRELDSGRNLQAFKWYFLGGVVHFYPDSDGNPYLEEGMIFNANDRLGYVYSKERHASEKQAEKDLYIAPWEGQEGRFIIRSISVNHGDTVEKGDRFFLYEQLEQ